jgi:PAS domain S-box-containing protein
MRKVEPQEIMDNKRLEALRSLCLLDTPADPAFDRLTRLASKILKAPVSLVSLVDADYQYFKSMVGLPEPYASQRQTPLSHSFCQHVITSGEPLVITDARENPLVCNNLAIPDLNVIAYAGIPITTSDGYSLGSFCVIDSKPRVWTEEEISILTDLAESVMTEIELHQKLMEREHLHRVLEERENFIQHVLHTSPDVIYVFDLLKQSNVYSNREIGQVIGYSPEEIIAMDGRLFELLIHPDDMTKVETNVTAFDDLDDDEIREIEYRMQHRNGEWRWLYSRETVFRRDADGKPYQIVGVAQDITLRKQAELEQQELYNRVSELEQIKTDMIRIAAHDLRTPIAVIVPAVNMIEMDSYGLSEAQAEYLGLIQNAAERMRMMITDILSLERIEDSQRTERIDLCKLVSEVFEERRIFAKQKALQFDLAADHHALKVLGDTTQLREVIDNLIGNAIKYTPDGGAIMVRVSPNGDHKVVFEVEDNGYGIKSEQQAHLFRAFFRASSKETRNIEGTGLGLHLVKRIVERHGGQIRFHSVYGEGSTFGFELGRV